MKLTDKQQDEKRIAWATGKPAPEVIEEGAGIITTKDIDQTAKITRKISNKVTDIFNDIKKARKIIKKNDAIDSKLSRFDQAMLGAKDKLSDLSQALQSELRKLPGPNHSSDDVFL